VSATNAGPLSDSAVRRDSRADLRDLADSL